ncbi:MAG: hypothetical protein GX257_11365 [Clostridiales bacterium]|nr:hypothetical protein [Clostridiales bacterium]
MKKVYRVKRVHKDNDFQKMDLSDWFAHYEVNTGIYWQILRQQIRGRKYDLEYGSDLDDLMQSAIEQVILQFQKKETIPSYWKLTSFKMAAKNAINSHIRAADKFAARPSAHMLEKYGEAKIAGLSEKTIAERKKHYSVKKFGFIGDGDRVPVTLGNYSQVEILVDLERILTPEQLKITKLLNQGYLQTEIAKMTKVDVRTIRRQVSRIRKSILAAKLLETA